MAEDPRGSPTEVCAAFVFVKLPPSVRQPRREVPSFAVTSVLSALLEDVAPFRTRQQETNWKRQPQPSTAGRAASRSRRALPIPSTHHGDPVWMLARADLAPGPAAPAPGAPWRACPRPLLLFTCSAQLGAQQARVLVTPGLRSSKRTLEKAITRPAQPCSQGLHGVLVSSRTAK